MVLCQYVTALVLFCMDAVKTSSKILKQRLLYFFQVETSTGSVIPASFEGARCPDEIVRRIRVSASYEDCSWNGKLLDTYDTQTDQFRIASCCWYIARQ